MKQKKKYPSYFDREIQKNGDNFMIQKTPDQIQRDAERSVFPDMIRGNIDYQKHGSYFQDPQFLNILVQEAERLRDTNYLEADALHLYCTTTPAPQLAMILFNRHRQRYECYCILVDALNAVRCNMIGGQYAITPLLGVFEQTSRYNYYDVFA